MLEALKNNIFTYKKLTKEEQQKRGILGRLVGVIADSKNPTRNGRKYTESLWEHVFNDPIMQEKIENRCCFGELGHPAEREEVDLEKIAICLAEKPKMGNDGKLYGVFDILNTPCGKILKALCDYGTNIGVSSRGSGDIMDNDEVDPETYYCECWDAVITPAVKSARPPYVTESLDRKTLKLKQTLRESYDKASDEDKKIMQEKLDELNINLENDDLDAIQEEYDEVDENGQLIDSLNEENSSEDVVEIFFDNKITEDVDSEEVEDEEESEESEEEPKEEENESEDEEQKDAEEETTYTVKDLLKELKDFDKDLNIEFVPIVIDGVEYPVEMLEFNADDDDKVVVSIGYNSEMSDNIEDEVEGEEIPEAKEEEVEASEETVFEEPEVESEEAEDNGADEMMESFKEIIRQKDLLEKQLRTLQNDKTVSDAEVKELKEELNKYKAAFARTSEVAAKTKSLEANVNSLTEKLNQSVTTIKTKDQEIRSLKESQQTKLTEDVEQSARQIRKLSESLNSTKQELDESNKKITEQANIYKQKLNECTEIAKKYKAHYNAALKEYIDFRAEMLGVRPVEITNRLGESYTIANVKKVCDDILESSSVSTIPFNFNNSSKIRINEARNSKQKQDDDDLRDLYELAGLQY